MKRGQIPDMSGAFVMLGICGLLLIASWTALARQVNDWGLLPQPERYSELYYGNYRQLAAAQLGKPCTISFTVINDEHRRTNYHYQLFAQTEGNSATVTLATGTISIPAGEQQTITKTVTIPELGNRVRATAAITYASIRRGTHSLHNQSQTINYWVSAAKTTQDGGNT